MAVALLEYHMSDRTPTLTARFRRLVGWLEGHGGQAGRLRVRDHNGWHRGVHADTAIAADQVILEVPLACLMTTERARESDIGRAIDESSVELGSVHSYIAAFLLQEREDSASFWRPYLDLLPASYPAIPLFFEPPELELLTGSFTLTEIEERRAELVGEYENLRRCVPGFDRFTCEEFIWARMTVITRIFGLHINGQKTEGLVPVADMLNHKRPPETRWSYEDGCDAFVMTPVEDLAPGQEVHDSYGAKCNSRFFVNYGFCIEDNDENCAEIPLIAMPQDHPLYDDVLAMGLRVRDGVLRFRVPASYASDDTRRMFSFLRLACTDELDLALLRQAEWQEGEIGPISVNNEHAVLAALADACRQALGRFDTTLEHDVDLLKDPLLYGNARNCVLVRSGEKRVLQAYIDLAESVVPLLHTPLPAAAAPAVDVEQFGGYVTDLFGAFAATPECSIPVKAR